MKLKDLKTLKSQYLSGVECHIKENLNIKFNKEETARIILSSTDFAFASKTVYCDFDIAASETKSDVLLALQKGYTILAEVEDVLAEKGLLYLYLVIFSNKAESYGDISAYVSDDDLVRLADKFKLTNDMQATLGKMQKLFLLEVGNYQYFAYSNYDIVEEESGSEESTPMVMPTNGLTIYGDASVVTLKSDKAENSTVVICRKILRQSPRNIPQLRLAECNLIFVNERIEASLIIKQKLDKIKESDTGFLSIWDKYKEEERTINNKRSESIGKLICKNPEFRGESRYAFSVWDKDILENIQIGDVLGMISGENDDEIDSIPDEKKRVSIVSIGADEIVVEGQKLVGGEEFLLSNSGNDTQMKRRDAARVSILSGTCANPLLGLIVEGELEQITVSENWRTDKLPALSSFVRDKIFPEHPPTETQENAISIALNTPDIAIIQGPPGTGKTTVITAIIERLNEEYDKKNEVKGRILITGFQHDAVENIISRLYVNSLPTIKFGRRNNGDDGETINTRLVEKWCAETANQIRSKNPQIQLTEQQQRLSVLLKIYVEYASDANAIKLLEVMSYLPLDKGTLQEVDDKLSVLKTLEEVEDFSDMLKSVRRLRVTLKGFNDDGMQRVYDLTEKLRKFGENFDSEIAVLERALSEEVTKDLLTECARIRQHLLEIFTPRPTYRTPKIDNEIISLCERAVKKLVTPQNSIDSVVVDFLTELENNPYGITESLKDYNIVYAATTGQSVAKGIIDAKGDSGYDTIIVDEAARVNPLDLLIPLAKAKRRIILVGDHRQLPHLYNEEIANRITVSEANESESKIQENEIDYIKRSMFEHLLGRAKKLEELDGIRRTITLDAQYRTHPLLGDFVNRQFYKKYGESFDSPLPESLFVQNLPLSAGKPCVWVDVPTSRGKMSKSGTSWTRRIEAEIIAEHIKSLIDSDEGSAYTFGVITFYAAQREKIKDVMRTKYGITEEQYRLGERLKIGTVDAFQGMEFDIVFLSTVRDSSGESSRYPFGRLTTENLLCVSMSRQKRLLVSVGDMMLFETERAKSDVPSLNGFAQLCKEYGVIR